MYALILYAHLMSACVAIGILLQQDFALWQSRNRALTHNEIIELKNTTTIVFIALFLLWLSGISMVTMGYLQNPEIYFSNQKLWAKFSVVIILTVNGFFLHHYSFPRITGNKGILELPNFEKKLVAYSGALSTTSWLFACYLGMARPWNFTTTYEEVMAIYGLLLAGALITAYAVVHTYRPTARIDLHINSDVRDAI